MTWAAAAPYIAAGIGSMMGGKQAKAANQPSRQSGSMRLSPYGGTQNLDNLMDLQRYGLGYGLANAEYGPNALMDSIYNNMLGRFEGGHGFGVPGGGGIGADWLGYGGGPSLPEAVGMSPEEIAQFVPEISAGLQGAADGDFLFSNPHTDRYINSVRDDAIRSFRETAIPGVTSEFVRAGRTGSNALGGALARANEGFQSGLGSLLGGIRSSDFNSERDRMMQALGLISGETQGARSYLTGMRNQDSSSATAIQNARTAANIAKYNADINASIAGASLDQQAALAEFGHMMQAYGLGQQQHAATNEGAFLPMNAIGQFSSMYSPLLSGFGTQYSTGQGWGQPVSVGGSALAGGLGAGLSTQGLMGGKKEDAVPAAPVPTVPMMGGKNQPQVSQPTGGKNI